MDYGHYPILGISVPSDHHARALAAAQAADRLGYGRVSVSSTPSAAQILDDSSATSTDAASLDPWTVTAWIAGGTKNVKVRADFRTLDQGQAMVLARAAASLDLLADGRAELAITTHEDDVVDRLTEATAIIKATWDAASRVPLSFVGDFNRVSEAPRGPAPAHAMSIWMGGVTEPELVAAGELADGWIINAQELLTSDGTLDLHALAQHLSTVDRAAVAMGRDPREIRRNITVNPGVIEGLAEREARRAAQAMAALVGAGIAEISLATTDIELIEFVADQVWPLALELVAAQRDADGTVVGVAKNIVARAQRTSGVDYDSVPAQLRDRMVEPGDPHYGNFTSTYMRGGSPALVLRPRTAEDVAAAVTWAKTQPVELSIRSAGHGISGKSTNRGGIIIDLRELREIEIIDESAGLVRVGPGAQWAEVAAELNPYGLAISSGDSGSVGVGGLATVGGIGFFSRDHGLTIDYIRALEIVTADGRIVRASETENPELFWGMRGAGPNFGIVTSFEFQARKVGLIGFAQLQFAVDDLTTFLADFGRVVEDSERDVTMFLVMGKPQPGQPLIAQVYGAVNSSDAEVIVDRLQPFANLAPMVGQTVYLTTYSGAIGAPHVGPQQGQGNPVSRAGAARHISRELAREIEVLIRSGQTFFFQIRTAGGAASDVDEEATAFSPRDAQFHLLAMGSSMPRLERAWEPLAEHLSGYYLNMDTDLHPERVRAAFTQATWDRLVALKQEWDPQNVFRDNFNIAPDAQV